jgi:Glyoxalase-like domain
MATKFQVTIDCADPDRLTRFWAVALGYRVPDPPPG